MNSVNLRLRFDVINFNGCPKFHVDAVKARLVCTYRGTGTQYGLSVDGQDPEQIVTVLLDLQPFCAAQAGLTLRFRVCCIDLPQLRKPAKRGCC